MTRRQDSAGAVEKIPRRPIALVYRGPATTPGCPEAVANLLTATEWNFDVRYVGPGQEFPLCAATLADATLYAQPGGDELEPAYRLLRKHRKEIRAFVQGGGRYLGFCLGGYLAGATPGFGLLPGDTDQYISSKAATVRTDGNAMVEVSWRGQPARMFFQDGPYFWVRGRAAVTVLATYQNKRIAALVAEFGSGAVGVVGPHPEATKEWFDDAGLPATASAPQPGLDLVNTVMKR